MCEERQLVSQVILLAISYRIKDQLLIRHLAFHQLEVDKG